MIHDVIRLTCKRPVTISKLCEKLSCSDKELRTAVDKAKGEGYQVQIVQNIVFSRIASGPTNLVKIGSSKPGRYHTVHYTDPHLGSKHSDRKAQVDFFRECWKRKASAVACTGDILDGNKEVLLPDQSHIGFDSQVEDLQTVLWDAFKGHMDIPVVVIDGNHDGYFSASSGFISGEVVAARMRDAGFNWHFSGVCLGNADIHGAKWQLWHPHGAGGSRNGVRRILNARAEGIQEPCDVLALGHFHRHATVNTYPEKIFAIAGGTFQRKASEFGQRIMQPWDIGGSIVSHTISAKRRACEISAEFIAFDGREVL